MTFHPHTILSCLAAGGLMLIAAGGAHAQIDGDTGIVRITDMVSAPATTGVCPHGSVADCPQCPSPSQGCWLHGHPCANGCHQSRCAHHVHAMLDWFNPYGAGTRSPDHGFSPPTKLRTYRRPVAYQKFFPDAWTGAAPMDAGDLPRPHVVYMPTDTTQLGYYYQHIPRWWPAQGMTPPTPRPRDWHVPMCSNGVCTICPQGTVIESATDEGIPGNVIEPVPNAEPVPMPGDGVDGYMPPPVPQSAEGGIRTEFE